MESKQSLAPADTISAFQENSDNDWRNSFYIECTCCKYTKKTGCGDFLFVPAASGRPILLPIQDAETIFDLLIDKSECLGVMSNLLFSEIYRKWVSKSQESGGFCPLMYIVYQ